MQLYRLLSHTPRQLSDLLTHTHNNPVSLNFKHADNSRLNSSLTLCKVTGFVMKVLNGRSLQHEWECVVNGLHKALFIHAPIQPAPVPVRRRDIATGVYVPVWEVCVPVVCRLAKGMTRHPVVGRSEQGAFRGYTLR